MSSYDQQRVSSDQEKKVELYDSLFQRESSSDNVEVLKTQNSSNSEQAVLNKNAPSYLINCSGIDKSVSLELK